MRRSISLLLVLMLVFSISTTVFAEENLGEGQHSGEVTGTYEGGNAGSGTVFSVDIVWEGMEFTYHAAEEPVWDAKNHKYSDYVAAYWEGEGTITVTNHSNTVISAVPEFVKDSGFEQAELVFSTSKLHLASSEFMAFGENQTGTITVTADGSLPAETDGRIGVVKVTIAEDTDVTLVDAEALHAKADALALEAEEYDISELNSFKLDVVGFLNNINGYKNSPADYQSALNTSYQRVRNNYYIVLSKLNALKAG